MEACPVRGPQKWRHGHMAGERVREGVRNACHVLNFYFWGLFAPFRSCWIFASLHILGAIASYLTFVSGLDICLSSCSMMSD